MEYNGIQLNSCIPHNTVFATLQRAKAALHEQKVEKWDTDSDSDKSDDEKDLAV